MTKKFVKLNYSNVENYYRGKKLLKGALVRYRFSHNTMLTYGLDEEEEAWKIGIVSDVNWYIFRHPPNSYMIETTDKELICYDLTVHPSDHIGTEMINLESNEIYLLTD